MGAGVGIVKVATPVLIQEIAHPRLRPILGSCYQTFAYVGSFFAAFMTCEYLALLECVPELIIVDSRWSVCPW
jgi:hypothetical protein